MPRKPSTPCAGCGELMWHGPGSLPAGQAMCRPCRRVKNGVFTGRCGTVGKYRRGCRCEACRAAKTASFRAYAAARRATGFDFHEYRQTPTRSDWIKPSDRQAIYERDNWTCQICQESIDPALPHSDRMSATLDHIAPRSLTLFPDHRPENLRTAHRSCNSIRGNRVDA